MEAKRQQKKNREVQPSKSTENTFCSGGDDPMDISNPKSEEEDLKKIHLENSRRLAELSTEEIEAERNEIISKLDPKLLDFIRKRKNPTQTNPKPNQPKDEPEPEKKIYKTEMGADVKVSLPYYAKKVRKIFRFIFCF